MTVCSLRNSVLAISGLSIPRATSCSTSSSRESQVRVTPWRLCVIGFAHPPGQPAGDPRRHQRFTAGRRADAFDDLIDRLILDGHPRDRLLGEPGLGDDLDPTFTEQAHETAAKQLVVVDHHDRESLMSHLPVIID